MDVAVLLLLPLVGGYFFTHAFYSTRYKALREEGHRLYFRAAFWGAVLFGVAFLLRLLLELSDGYLEFEAQIRSVFGPLFREADQRNSIPLAITSVLAMFLGTPLAALFNLFVSKDKSQEDAIRGNDLELLANAAANARRPLAVTLKNRKVYIGFILKSFDPSHDRKWITLLPLISGYRTPDQLRLEFTTNYKQVYGDETAEKLPGALAHLSAKDFEVTVPVDEIAAASLFDLVAYAQFSKRSDRTEAEVDRQMG